ncbi:Ig-like domain-containing protein [Bacillus salipaludis]|uniref:Ig-like domain-containing protein n=1 Tax=Bacillus salipaludis TaxID=2547811 RepID=A0AA90TQL3_9BACI|nr:Ig-like domain-containing protein [Bacillus salipaludis]MDQ6595020.1 Ig-like domain-containing protein [Bacillus salipaludis]
MKKKIAYAGIAAALLLTGFQSTTAFAASPSADVQKSVAELSSIHHVNFKDSKLKNLDVSRMLNKTSKEGFRSLATKSDIDYIIEQEPNDSPELANPLKLGTGVVGDFSFNGSRDGDFDLFAINVIEPGYLFLAGALNPIDGLTRFGFGLFDPSGEMVEPEYADSEDGIVYQFLPVEPGTYYIAAANLDDYVSYDQYLLFAAMVDETAPDAPKVDPIDDNDKTVSGKAEASSKVTIKNGTVKYTTVTTDKTGTFKVNLAKPFKAGTKLTFTAEDAAGNVSKSTTLTVKDKTPPAPPKVNRVDDNDKSISGKAEAYSKITIKNGSKSFATTNTDKYGNFKVSIKPVKAGTKLYVTATDKSNNVSKASTVTVVDKTSPALKVNTVYKTSKYVSGKTEARVSVTVKAGSKTLAKGKADTKGYYKLKIKAQKKNTVLTITAKDAAGNTKVVKIKVK